MDNLGPDSEKHTGAVNDSHDVVETPQTKQEPLKELENGSAPKSRRILIQDVTETVDQLIQATSNQRISQLSRSQPKYPTSKTIAEYSKQKIEQRSSLPNKIIFNHIDPPQQTPITNKIDKTHQISSPDMRHQRTRTINGRINYPTSHSTDKLKLRLTYEKLPAVTDLPSARKALSSRNMPRDVRDSSPYYRRPVNSIRSRSNIKTNIVTESSNDFDKVALHEESRRKKASADFSELVRTKLQQQRTLRNLFQGLDPIPQHNSSQQSFYKRNYLTKLGPTNRENGTLMPQKSEMLVLDPAILNHEDSTADISPDRNNKSREFIQKFKKSESQTELPVLKGVNENTISSQLFKSQFSNRNIRNRKTPDKRHDEKALEIAKDHLYNKRRVNYTKLLRETFLFEEKKDPKNESNKKVDEYEEIRRYLVRKEKNRSSQDRFEQLIKMDIASDMAPLEEAVEKYKVCVHRFDGLIIH